MVQTRVKILELNKLFSIINNTNQKQSLTIKVCNLWKGFDTRM